MRKYLVVALMLAGWALTLAQTGPHWMWAIKAGNPNADDEAVGVSRDAAGNIYVCGNFCGSATFGGTTLISQGNVDDIFVTKLDANGNWIWAVKAGSSHQDSAFGIAADSSGNCYVTGFTWTGASFGDLLLTTGAEENCAFVAKLNTSGQWLWVNGTGGAGFGDEAGYSVDADNAGNSYVTGYMRGIATFGSITKNTGSDYATNAFIAKLDSSGNWLWVNQAGGSDYNNQAYGNSIDVSSDGYCTVTGEFSGTVTFGANSLHSTPSPGTVQYCDIFVSRLDTSGSYIWARRAGGSGYDKPASITVDNEGNSYIAGNYEENATFGSINLDSDFDGWDTYAAKLDTNGNWIWANKAGSVNGTGPNCISVDSEGNTYVAGHFVTNAYFDPNLITGDANFNHEIFVAKLNVAGAWQWAISGGGASDDVAMGISTDADGYSCVVGYINGPAVFGNTTINNVTSNEILIAKLAPEGTAIEDSFNPPGSVPSLVCNIFPNPFREQTTISFTTKDASPVRMEIYNVKGQLITSLCNNETASGNHRIAWMATDNHYRKVKPGIYFVKMLANRQISTTKLLLLD